jgi:16S rRNA (guanine527-N7)-methyltransferase
MKGERPQEELKQIPEQFSVNKIYPVMVPSLNAKRHLVFIKRK